MAVKVLVVDDASFVRDLVKRTMRTHFPEVSMEEAINGRKAQLLMSKQVFDLVLCDWEMPEMTGLELLQWARASEHYKTVPFIMVTSRGDRGHVLEAVQQGASDYLGKPFSPEMLLQKVTKAIGKKLRSSGGGAKANPLANNSASILTGAPVVPRPTASVSEGTAALLAGAGRAAGLTTPPPGNETQTAETGSSGSSSGSPKGLAQIRFADFNLPCIIKAISLTEIKVVARRGQRFPMILDPAVVDIEADEGQILERINGYVHQLQAVDKRMDTDFVSLIIRFVDEDPVKMASLSKFIEKFN
ncbi:MAG: response regulator [Hahellaceae bacterium]|jgi:CheY-like chemotaxis protein|nr:response regulator [Hahellaceae bacterium]